MLDFLLKPIVGIVGSVLDKVLPATKMSEAEQADFKLKTLAMITQADMSELQGQVQVITAEAGGNWLQKSWRPILMLSIVAIIVNNYILVPYLSLFTANIKMLELPDKLWSLMELGVSGYVVGRSAEKITSNLRRSSNGK